MDLRSLTDIEQGKDFILAWQGNIRKLVMDEECRILFCNMLNVPSGSLHTYEIPQKRRPIVHLNAPFPWRLEPHVSFARPHGFYDSDQRSVITNEALGVAQSFPRDWTPSIMRARLFFMVPVARVAAMYTQ